MNEIDFENWCVKLGYQPTPKKKKWFKRLLYTRIAFTKKEMIRMYRSELRAGRRQS